MMAVSPPFSRRPLVAALACLATIPFNTWAQTAPENVTQLQNIVVTASGFEQVIADAPATITVITEKELQGKAYRNVTDALQDIPGVSIEGGASGKFESTNINIRGLSESYVLFLVDGQPLGASSEAYYNGFGGGAQVNFLPPMSAIERIEVIRGPMSSLYGSSAMGGVINIITKKVASTWSGEVSADTTLQERSESGNAFQGRYYLSGPLIENRLGLSVAGSHFQRHEDKILNGYGKQRINNNEAKLDWILNDAHSLSFKGGVTTTDNLRTERSSGSANGSDMNNRRNHYGVTHDWKWATRNQTTTYLTHEDVRIGNGAYESKYQGTIANTKTLIPLDQHMITVGAEYKYEKTLHDASRFPGSKSLNLSRWQAAVFAEDEFSLTDDFIVTGGLRYDKNQHYGTHITPRLYGVFHATENLIVKGGVSGGYKTPTLKQADDRIVEIAARGRSWDMGNRDLKPESSINYEMGFNWQNAQDINFSLMAYHTRFKDKIDKWDYCSSPNPNVWSCTFNGETRQSIRQYINLDRARLQGLEAAFGMPLTDTLHLDANYTLASSKITSGTSKGKPLTNTPRHMFNVGVKWDPTEALNIWGKAKYKSSSIDTDSSGVPAYTIVDLGVNYNFTKNLSGYAGIYNLFDKQIDTDNGYNKYLDGRRYFVGASVRF